MAEENSDVRIARLEEKLDSLIKSVDLMTTKMDDYAHTFVPRTEFERLDTLIRGIAGSGGLVKQIEDVKDRLIRYVTILGIAWFLICAAAIAGWQYFLVIVNRPINTTTTNTTTNNK